MAEYMVNYAGLAQFSESLRQATRQMDGEVNSLEADVERTLSVWEGAARDNYHVHKKKWDAAFVRMAQILDRSGLTVETMRENYQHTDHANASAWG